MYWLQDLTSPKMSPCLACWWLTWQLVQVGHVKRMEESGRLPWKQGWSWEIVLAHLGPVFPLYTRHCNLGAFALAIPLPRRHSPVIFLTLLSLWFSLLSKPPLILIFKVISSIHPITLFCSIFLHSTVFYFTFRKKLCFLSVSLLCFSKDVNFVKAGLKKHLKNKFFFWKQFRHKILQK